MTSNEEVLCFCFVVASMRACQASVLRVAPSAAVSMIRLLALMRIRQFHPLTPPSTYPPGAIEGRERGHAGQALMNMSQRNAIQRGGRQTACMCGSMSACVAADFAPSSPPLAAARCAMRPFLDSKQHADVQGSNWMSNHRSCSPHCEHGRALPRATQ
eukprot:TRINITY_DN5860_c0_g1_i1.p1 TRINITY_DN5860_c0_g1~~TRINITY_DN5860_c0_g1_i1.p1  ORF type:complete len:158 (-),score=10.24 TRINITY_DN5860_c0_g1_i1:407-880(-)